MSPPEKSEHFRLVEVEPAGKADVPRHIVGAVPPERPGENPAESWPIPQRPEHICPQCDYNLTGLTSRRCPECGEPFTLLEARIRGIELSDGVQSVVRLEQLTRIKLYAGGGLIALSVWMQNVTSGGLAGWLGLRLTQPGRLMLFFLLPLFVGAYVYKLAADRTWEETIWLTGLVAGCAGLALRLS